MSLGGFPIGSAGKESACNVGDLGLIPGLGRSPGEGKCYPLQYSGLENSMDWIVHGVTKSRTRLSDFHSFEFRVTMYFFLTLSDFNFHEFQFLPQTEKILTHFKGRYLLIFKVKYMAQLLRYGIIYIVVFNRNKSSILII